MKRDLATAYAASFARVASWAIVAGLVYRQDGAIAFAALSFQRAILTVMMISGLGLAPALVILLPRIRLLSPRHPSPEEGLLGTGFVIATGAATCLIVVGAFAFGREDSSKFWEDVWRSYYPFLAATGLRLMSDVIGARLQTDGRLAVDNLLQALADGAWVILTIAAVRITDADRTLLSNSAKAYLIVNGALLIGRFFTFNHRFSLQSRLQYDRSFAKLLLGTGAVLLLAQCADLLYAPANQFVIEHFLGTFVLATYAPLLHIDAGLLLGVTGLANVLLPKSAIAHGAGDQATIRKYYVWGSLTSAALLAIGAAIIYFYAAKVFKLWFGNPLPATQAILPWVMIHTVIGGSAGIGRSILFGIGRIRAYTIAAILGGVANVALAILFVTQTSLGLKGIVLATIITVTIRCAIWMPWYVLKVLRSAAAAQSIAEPTAATKVAIAPPPVYFGERPGD